MQQGLGEEHLHPSQMAILDYIGQHAGCTQIEISENMALTPAAITLATQRLQKEGLLEKQTDRNNLRRNRLTLTEKGAAYRKEKQKFFAQVDAKTYQGFSEEELNQLKTYLDRIATNITGEETNEISFRVIQDLADEVCKQPIDRKGGQ